MAAPGVHNAADLVCEGGGVKGIDLAAGADSVLEEHDYQPSNVAGNSAGRFTAALIAAGYSADELKKIVFEMDFPRFEDKSWEDHIPGAGVPLTLLLRTGVYKGEEFYDWLRGLLSEKNVYTCFFAAARVLPQRGMASAAHAAPGGGRESDGCPYLRSLETRVMQAKKVRGLPHGRNKYCHNGGMAFVLSAEMRVGRRSPLRPPLASPSRSHNPCKVA